MPVRVAINGFGRIGRAAYKLIFDNPELEVVAINDLGSPRVLAHLLKFDSAYKTFQEDIFIEENGISTQLLDWSVADKYFQADTVPNSYLVVDGKRAKMFSEKEPINLPWKDLAVDVVLECTGFFTKDDAALIHIQAGAKKVIVSAPTKGGQTQTFLFGANHEQYLGQNAISNASCTTNCISPVISVMNKAFGVLKAGLTTVHAVTAGQNIVDGAPPSRKPDMRSARAGSFNIIPTTTGAAIATTQAIPELQNKFDGLAIRVPVITGSISDITMLLERPTTVAEINQAFIDASNSDYYKKILAVSHEPIVSSDIIGSSYSAIIDLAMTKVIDGDFVKVLAWYDNEWGYANRLVEMALMVGK